MMELSSRRTMLRLLNKFHTMKMVMGTAFAAPTKKVGAAKAVPIPASGREIALRSWWNPTVWPQWRGLALFVAGRPSNRNGIWVSFRSGGTGLHLHSLARTATYRLVCRKFGVSIWTLQLQERSVFWVFCCFDRTSERLDLFLFLNSDLIVEIFCNKLVNSFTIYAKLYLTLRSTKAVVQLSIKYRTYSMLH